MEDAAARPTGTVTFLFTDIEGSTRLAQQYPDAMPDLLARHHAILNRSIEPYNGRVFQIAGDAFCMAFRSAGEALQAAIAAQRALQGEPWPSAPIKVRMGIHTGEAHVQAAGGYDGYLTLSHVQRLMSAAHGGQILISSATYELVRDDLPEDITVRDMGDRRLKDVARPERIYQLVIPGLPADFPPIITLDTHRHNLPAQITSFIGREKERAAINGVLSEHRLVSLTGSGGAGKTRLAIELASECVNQYPDGVWLAELAPVSSPALVPQTLLSIFNLREDPRRTALEALADHLRDKSLLLVLDNCEHLIQACAQVAEMLLHACANIRVLATSREALGIAGEFAYRVPSLSVPESGHLPSLDELSTIDSVQLFLQRAAAVKPGFTLTGANAFYVAQICSRLDGIPLAIELAASRMQVLSPEQVAARLDDRFRLLTGGSRTALPRQQTLRAMIDWSYSLLSEQEKTLFRRLAVFAGGWTLEAAETVCGEASGEFDVLDLLTRLVEKSLVFVEESMDEFRYHRLETIRQYSREKLFDTDEVTSLRDRHLDYYVRFAESVDGHLQTGDQVVWQRRMSAELDNLRTALEWGLSQHPDSALRIAGAANLFWTAGGFSAEGFRWTQEALKQVDKMPLPASLTAGERLVARARALRGLARLYLSLGDNPSARRAAEDSVALYRQSQDRRGLAFALVVLAYPLEFLGARVEAEEGLHEAYALARAEADVYLMCRSLNRLARVMISRSQDVDLAQSYIEESIGLSHDAGLRSQEAQAFETLGMLAAQRNEPDEARLRLRQSMDLYEQIGASFNVILEKSNLAHLERQLGQYDKALAYYRETIVGFRDIGQIGAVAHQLECFGFIALAQNQPERALQLFAAAGATREKSSTPMTPDEQAYFDAELGVLHQKVDPTRFASLWSQAAGLTMQQAIELALA